MVEMMEREVETPREMAAMMLAMRDGMFAELAMKLGVAKTELERGRREQVRRIAESAGVTIAHARRKYGEALDDLLETVVDLVRDGYPPEIGALLPFYWVVGKPAGWYVLGGAYGQEVDPDKLDAYSSEEEAKSEAALYARLDLAAVKAIDHKAFTDKVRAELRRLDREMAQ